MTRGIHKWILSATLAGALTATTGMSVTARAQQPPLDQRKDAAKNGVKDDEQQIRALRGKVNRDKEELRADERRFGRNSPQARTSWTKLQEDQAALRAMEQDRKDAATRDRRFHRHSFRGGRF